MRITWSITIGNKYRSAALATGRWWVGYNHDSEGFLSVGLGWIIFTFHQEDWGKGEIDGSDRSY